MTGINSDRRKFLAASGTALTIAVAGCSGGGDSGGDDGGDGGDDGGMDGVEVSDTTDSYLSEANLYEGTAVDETGSDSVTIEVGAGENGFAFNPPAVAVDSGTTVTWEWTGTGGGHNVLADDSSDFSVDVESELVSEEGATAENTFEEAGTYHYYCNPHRASGMLGAVIVE